ARPARAAEQRRVDGREMAQRRGKMRLIDWLAWAVRDVRRLLWQQVEDLEEQRRGGVDAESARPRRALRAADPHRDRIAIGIAERPGIAETVGRAGLIGDGAGL